MIAYLQSQDQVLTVRKRSVAKNIRASLCIARNAQSYRLSAFSILIFLFFLTTSNAQSVEVSAGFNRLDYQVGAGYSHRWGALFLTSKMEVAVTSTFAQKRFAPRLSVGASYLLLKKGQFEFGPELVYAYSRQRLTNNHKTAHHWNELNIGYRLQVGGKFKFVHSLNGGWINESFYTNSGNERVNYNNLGVYAQVGVSYTF